MSQLYVQCVLQNKGPNTWYNIGNYMEGEHNPNWAEWFFGQLKDDEGQIKDEKFFQLLHNRADLDTCCKQMAWKIVASFTRDSKGNVVFDPFEPVNFNEAHQL